MVWFTHFSHFFVVDAFVLFYRRRETDKFIWHETYRTFICIARKTGNPSEMEISVYAFAEETERKAKGSFVYLCKLNVRCFLCECSEVHV